MDVPDYLDALLAYVPVDAAPSRGVPAVPLTAPVYVVAHVYSDALRAAAERNLASNQWRFLTSPVSLRGLTEVRVLLVDGWDRRVDLAAIEAALLILKRAGRLHYV